MLFARRTLPSLGVSTFAVLGPLARRTEVRGMTKKDLSLRCHVRGWFVGIPWGQLFGAWATGRDLGEPCQNEGHSLAFLPFRQEVRVQEALGTVALVCRQGFFFQSCRQVESSRAQRRTSDIFPAGDSYPRSSSLDRDLKKPAVCACIR